MDKEKILLKINELKELAKKSAKELFLKAKKNFVKKEFWLDLLKKTQEFIKKTYLFIKNHSKEAATILIVIYALILLDKLNTIAISSQKILNTGSVMAIEDNTDVMRHRLLIIQDDIAKMKSDIEAIKKGDSLLFN